MRAGGDLPLEPFARMRIRAAEEGWAREEAERQEREKRRRVKVLSGVTLLVLVVVLACRCIGVGKRVGRRRQAETRCPRRCYSACEKPPHTLSVSFHAVDRHSY